MVIKEYRCSSPECGRDFEGIVPVCPRCGTKGATRVFLTPVGINGGKTQKGSAKSIDRILEAEFKRQGISNFTNRGGENKVTWARRIQQYKDSPLDRNPRHAPTRAYWSTPGDFTPLERDPDYGFQRNNVLAPIPFSGAGHTIPEMAPMIDQGSAPTPVNMEQVARTTPLPQSLAKKTHVIKTPRE